MRGLYFLACTLAVALCTVRADKYPRLPAYMQTMTPHELLVEIESLYGVSGKAPRLSLNEALRNVVESLRELMPEGVPSMGIPPLDPFYAEHAEMNLESNIVTATGSIDKVSVKDLAGYVVNSVSFNVIKLQLDFNFTLPVINVDGLYDVEGVLAVLPVYGAGAFTLAIQNFDFSGGIRLGINNGTVYIKDLPLDYHLGSLENNFEGLMGGGAMAEIVNQMITDLAPQMLEELKPSILGPFTEYFIAMADEALSNYTLAELIDMIMQAGKPKPSTTPASV